MSSTQTYQGVACRILNSLSSKRRSRTVQCTSWFFLSTRHDFKKFCNPWSGSSVIVKYLFVLKLININNLNICDDWHSLDGP